MEALTSALLLAVVVKSVLDAIAEPLRNKFPQLDLWWFDYVALVVGGVAAWFAEINLFAPYFANELLGRLMTAFVIGGGAKLINQVFSNANAPRLDAFVARSALDDFDTPDTSLPLVTKVTRPRGW